VKKAEWKLTRFDVICGILSLIGLALWLITKVGNIAILFSIVADALAALPTLVKAYKYPETEIAWPWLATCIGIVLTLLTLKELTFANSGFIIYIFIINLMIFGCCVRHAPRQGQRSDTTKMKAAKPSSSDPNR